SSLSLCDLCSFAIFAKSSTSSGTRAPLSGQRAGPYDRPTKEIPSLRTKRAAHAAVESVRFVPSDRIAHFDDTAPTFHWYFDTLTPEIRQILRVLVAIKKCLRRA